jgi:UDP-N-acetyl-D-glucosamine/UDP-N-acetyl-D-galactosamine dehydrogenase
VPDIVRELGQVGIRPPVHDPHCASDDALHEYGITLRQLEELTDLDGLILAVPHAEYLDAGPARIAERLKPGGVLLDVKSVISPGSVPPGVHFWSL